MIPIIEVCADYHLLTTYSNVLAYLYKADNIDGEGDKVSAIIINEIKHGSKTIILYEWNQMVKNYGRW